MVRFALVLATGLCAGTACYCDEVQQCVWACLYGPGNGNPASIAYGSCVEQKCTKLLEQPSSASSINASDPSRQWSAGTANNGKRYAGIDFPGRVGKAGLYYFCQPGGTSYLELVGDNALLETYVASIDGQQFQMLFKQGPNGALRFNLPKSDPFLAAVSSGTSLSLRYLDGNLVSQLSLTGSSKAMRFALSGC